MRRKNIVRLAIAIVAIFIIYISYSAYSIWTFGNKQQLAKTDVAVVLGAAVWNNEPSPVFRERINHAIWLYENDYVDKIIFTGGKAEGNNYAESEVARDYAIKNNVREEDILIENKSKITEENIKYAYEIAKENNFKTFAIVSDPLHMKRSMIMTKTLVWRHIHLLHKVLHIKP